jgi:DNA gyrase subunit B
MMHSGEARNRTFTQHLQDVQHLPPRWIQRRVQNIYGPLDLLKAVLEERGLPAV